MEEHKQKRNSQNLKVENKVKHKSKQQARGQTSKTSHVWWYVFAGVSIVGLILALLLVLPFLIDLSVFKNQIQNAVSQNVHARLDFSSARLRILPYPSVVLKDVFLIQNSDNFKEEKLFSVKNVVFRLELMPLFDKTFIGELEIDEPEFIFLRKGLKTNIAELYKGSEKTASQPQPPQTPQSNENTQALVESYKERVKLQKISIKNARFFMRNVEKNLEEPLVIKNLNIDVFNIGYNQNVTTRIYTHVQYNDNGILVQGPLNFVVNVHPLLENMRFKEATYNARFDLTSLDINVRQAFLKPKNVEFFTSFEGSVTPKLFVLKKFLLKLASLQLDASSQLELDGHRSFIAVAQLRQSSLAELAALLPQHKNFMTTGALSLNANFQGSASRPDSVQGTLDLVAKLGAGDIKLNLGLKSIKPPRLRLAIESKSLDVDALLKPFQAPQQTASSSQKQEQKSSARETKQAATKDSNDPLSLTPEQRAMLTGSDIVVGAKLSAVRIAGYDAKNIVVDFRQKDLVADLKAFQIDALGLKLQAASQIQLAATPFKIASQLSVVADKLDLAPYLGSSQTATGDAAPASTVPPPPSSPQGVQQQKTEEFVLAPEHKRLLQNMQTQLQLKIGSLLLKNVQLDNFDFAASQQGLLLAIKNLSTQIFDGKFMFKGNVDLSSTPIAYTTSTRLEKVDIQKLVAFLKPEYKNMLAGRFSFTTELIGKGITPENIMKNINANGNFLLQNAVFSASPVLPALDAEFQKFVSSLSVVKKLDDIIAQTEKILAHPAIKAVPNVPRVNYAQYKAEYDKVRYLKLSEQWKVEETIKELQGMLTLTNGKIQVAAKRQLAWGDGIDFKTQVGLDQSLTGELLYQVGALTKQQLLAKTKYASLLFDDKGNLSIQAKLGGSLTAPQVFVDWNVLKQRFITNAEKTAEKELRQAAEAELNRLLKGKADALLNETRKKAEEELAAARKKAEEEARAAKEKAEAEAREAQRKAEEEARKKAEEAKKRLEDEAKKKLQNIFKR